MRCGSDESFDAAVTSAIRAYRDCYSLSTARLRDVGEIGVLGGGFGFQVIPGEAVAENLECLIGGVRNLEQFLIAGRDGSLVDEDVEIDDFFPIAGAVEDDSDFFGELLRLGKGENFEHFVESAEASGKNDQGFCEIGEPVLAHEEVVELEVERGRDEAVGHLLKGQADVE